MARRRPLEAQKFDVIIARWPLTVSRRLCARARARSSETIGEASAYIRAQVPCGLISTLASPILATLNALDPRERSTFEHGLDGMASCDMAFDRASVQPVPLIEHVHGPAFYEVTSVRTDTYSRVLGGERHFLCVLECSV